MKIKTVYVLLTIFSVKAQDLIQRIHVHKNTLQISVNESFKKQYLTDDFFVEYEPPIDLEQFDYSILSLPFITNVVSIVWISGETYFVDEMDTELYESLKRVKQVFSVMYPKTSWSGELVPRKLVTHPRPFTDDHTKTALLFSGGIDSISSMLAHLDKKQLFITAWGHWDLPLNNQDLWKVRSHKINAYAENFGNKTTFLRSNYTSMLNYQYLSQLTPEIPKWRLGAVEGLGWAGLTAPILLATGITTLRIGSSHTWKYPYPSAASPFIDNNLRFCGLKVLHDQFALTRLQKVAYLDSVYTAHALPKPFLKICSYEKNEDTNCLACRKCLTTILCFIALGIDPEPYGLVYDEDKAVEILALFDGPALNFYTIVLCKEIQDTLKKRLRSGAKIDSMLKKFLRIDFDQKRAFDVEPQTKLSWPTLIALLPPDHGLEIPQDVGV